MTALQTMHGSSHDISGALAVTRHYKLLNDCAMHLSWVIINTYLRTGSTRWFGRVLAAANSSLNTVTMFFSERDKSITPTDT